MHIDLFSGIGGFSLAAEQAWPGMEHVFCDIDPFARAVTKKHWPDAKHYENIYHLIADAENSKQRGVRLERKSHQKDSQIGDCYLVTGGFPCQPFSQAGRRTGTADNRYLWPAMLRVIQLTHPQWVIGENVGGFVTWNEGMVLRQVFSDLESEGYEIQAFIIPACAVNAPHRRDRVWIVGHAERSGQSGNPRGGSGQKPTNGSTDDAYAKREGLQRGKLKARAGQRRQFGGVWNEKIKHAWREDWPEVASQLCGVDDGVSARVDGLELSKAKHRAERIKSLGNAIVPQVAFQIMQAIKDSEERGKNI